MWLFIVVGIKVKQCWQKRILAYKYPHIPCVWNKSAYVGELLHQDKCLLYDYNIKHPKNYLHGRASLSYGFGLVPINCTYLLHGCGSYTVAWYPNTSGSTWPVWVINHQNPLIHITPIKYQIETQHIMCMGALKLMDFLRDAITQSLQVYGYEHQISLLTMQTISYFFIVYM